MADMIKDPEDDIWQPSIWYTLSTKYKIQNQYAKNAVFYMSTTKSLKKTSGKQPHLQYPEKLH
jgi:hypothetical protein